MEINVSIQYKNEALHTLREKKGLSQSQLAKIAGVNLRMIQYYEQGRKDLNAAKFNTLLRLCNALDCSLAELVTDDETQALLKQYEQNTNT